MPIDTTQFDRDYQALERDWSDTFVWDGDTIKCQIDQWTKGEDAGIGGRAPEYSMQIHVRAGAFPVSIPNIGDEILVDGLRKAIVEIEVSEDGNEYVLSLERGS